MEEIITLRQHLEHGRYQDALIIAMELEEMAKDDKIIRVSSFATIILLHLIKQQAEQRSTRSWDLSIRNAAREIARHNKRRKAGGYYLDAQELHAALDEAYPIALDQAASEAFGGVYEADVIAQKVDSAAIIAQAMHLIEQQQQS
jgi:hypothetical protein